MIKVLCVIHVGPEMKVPCLRAGTQGLRVAMQVMGQDVGIYDCLFLRCVHVCVRERQRRAPPLR